MNMGPGGIGLYGASGYWLFSVIERAKSLDPEKIIKVWEGDVYQYPNGKIVKMRACDHKTIQPLGVSRIRAAGGTESFHDDSALLLVPGRIMHRAGMARSCRQGPSPDGSEAGSLQREKRLGGVINQPITD